MDLVRTFLHRCIRNLKKQKIIAKSSAPSFSAHWSPTENVISYSSSDTRNNNQSMKEIFEIMDDDQVPLLCSIILRYTLEYYENNFYFIREIIYLLCDL